MRFDREANFFKLPRRVLLAEKLRFVVEGTTEIVTHTLELPSSQRKSILSSMLANQPELLKIAEYLLRKACRFPDDIPAEHIVSNAERQQLEQSWRNIIP